MHRLKAAQMRFGSKHVFLGSVATVTLMATAPARSAVVSLTPGFPAGGSYNYTLTGAAGEQINTGDFFRVYDFAGLTTASSPPGWSISIAPTNPVPPPNVILLHGDNPTLPNLIYTYTAATPLLGPVTVPGFLATSSLLATTTKDFVARDTLASPPGGSVDRVGDITVPAPEPTGLALLAVAPVAALLRRGRNRC
jgi:hypothetical protein